MVVATFLGARANMVLARLLKNRIAESRHGFRYDPFAIRIFDWESAEGAERVAAVLEEIAGADPRVLAAEMPEVPDTTWKFGGMLTREMTTEMTCDEYYRLPEVVWGISRVRVRRS